MLRARVLCLALLALVAHASASRAAIFPARGELTFDVGNLDPFSFTTSLSVSVTTSAGGRILTLSVPGSPFATTGLSVDVNLTTAAPIQGLLGTVHNQGGVFTDLAGLVGVMPLAGVSRLCLFADCSTPFVPANVSVPLSAIGAGPGVTVYASGLVNLTVAGAAWRAFSVTGSDPGFVHGPLSATNTAAASGGVLQLVTPVFIQADVIGNIPTLVFMRLHLVPEPGTLLLAGLGVVGLGAMGWTRRKARAR